MMYLVFPFPLDKNLHVSKQKQEQRKKAKKDQRRKENLARYRQSLGSGSSSASDVLDRASYFMSKGRFLEARNGLLPYVEKHPKAVEPCRMLAEACRRVEDMPTMFWATEQLIQLVPDDVNAYLLHHSSCLGNDMPAATVLNAKKMRRRFPDHKFNHTIQKAIDLDQKIIEQFKIDAQSAGDDIAPCSDAQLMDLKHEQERCLVFLSSRRFDLVVQSCDRLIATFPFFRSAYNNKSLAILLDQGAEAAEQALSQALAHHPDNVYALSYKIRQLVLLGRRDEISPLLERLETSKPLPSNKLDFYTVKMETYAWASDEHRLLETFEQARKDIGDDWNLVEQGNCVHMTHLAAVAHAKQGRQATAIDLWKQVRRCPDDVVDPIAKENLDDIQKPAGQRNGAWYFSVDFWIPAQFFRELMDIAQRMRVIDAQDQEEQERLAERHIIPLYAGALKRWPYLNRTLIEMLRHGGPQARNWVCMCIGPCKTPEFVRTLQEFVAGPEGSDQCRFNMINEMSQRDMLPSGPIQRWYKGKPDDQYVFAFEITRQAMPDPYGLSRQGLQELSQSFSLTLEGELDQALTILKRINEREPNHPKVMFNIGGILERKGDIEEFDRIIDWLNETHPEYFFGKVVRANRLIREKRSDEAWEIILDLFHTKRMHVTEASAFFGAVVMYHLVRGETAIAEKVHGIGASMIKENYPSMDQLRYDAGLVSRAEYLSQNFGKFWRHFAGKS